MNFSLNDSGDSQTIATPPPPAISPPKANRRQYLITYSKANMLKFPTRNSFAIAVLNSFSLSGKVVVQQWACCLEEHENTSGQHYHMCIKLSGPKRWNPVKKYLTEKHAITVNFSESHENYYTAYKYVCKSDDNVLLSPNHPDLQEVGSPATKKCMLAYKAACQKRKSTSSSSTSTTSKAKKITNLDISEFLVAKNINTVDELLAKAHQQSAEGKKDLKKFVLGKSPKALQDLISTTWRMEKAVGKLQREKKERMTIVRDHREKECDTECFGTWYPCALEVLRANDIEPVAFAVAMRELLTKGRGKFRNILITGPANCGKTFMLLPMQQLFNTFSNPANDKFAWLGAENAELIFFK